MASTNGSITQAELRALIDYDQGAGVFQWRPRNPEPRMGWNTRYAGKVAGSLSTPKPWRPSYLKVRVNKRDYKAHRLAWFYMTGEWPLNDIDHIDGDGLNNRFGNLRLATRAENLRNSRPHKDARVPFKGVRVAANGSYQAEIMVSGKSLSLGLYATAEEAHNAYAMAAVEHFGEFARV